MAAPVLDVPVLLPFPRRPGPKEPKMNENDYGLLKMHSLNSAQRQSDGAVAYAENLRYAYLQGKDRMSFAEAQGVRAIVGPHPQYGSPDGVAAK